VETFLICFHVVQQLKTKVKIIYNFFRFLSRKLCIISIIFRPSSLKIINFWLPAWRTFCVCVNVPWNINRDGPSFQLVVWFPTKSTIMSTVFYVYWSVNILTYWCTISSWYLLFTLWTWITFRFTCQLGTSVASHQSIQYSKGQFSVKARNFEFQKFGSGSLYRKVILQNFFDRTPFDRNTI
jgi:hypothetical protein